MMDTAWYVVLRDLMVMLAAAAVVASSVFLALVGWQLYRLGKDVYVEIQPLLASMQDTADTVRHTAGFVNERLYARDGAVGVAAGAIGLAQHLRAAYRGMHAARSVPDVPGPQAGPEPTLRV